MMPGMAKMQKQMDEAGLDDKVIRRQIALIDSMTKKERADVWLSRTNCFQSARDVSRLVYDLVGGGAVYATRGPFDRHLRDAETMCQHIVGQEKGYETVGAMLFDPAGAAIHPLL